jgi:predicted  nucleic acid-binding Zn-ribbon protein
MPAKDLGTKHVCFKCGTKFYDMKKAEPLCPKCGADQRQSPALKPAASEKRARPAARPPPPPPLPADDAEVDTELADDADADEEEEDDDEDDEP